MPITVLLNSADWPNRTQEQEPFDILVASTFQKLPIAFQQMNAMEGSMNSLAAGGAYAMPYTFSSSASEVDPGSGKLGLSSTPQSSSVALRVNTTNSAGVDSLSLLNDFGASTSAVTGTVRLQKAGDPSKWLVFAVTAAVQYTGYMRLTVVGRGGSTASPFVAGDSVMMFFQRTGDKGDSGAATPVIHVREQQASGTNGGTSPSAGTVTRTLNTVVRNTIGAGASLASNQVTIPAGTYRIFASAPAAGALNHNLRLIDASDSSVIAYGTTEYAGSNNQSRSVITLEVVFAVSKTVYLQHYTAAATSANGLGIGISSGLCVFSEMFIERVS